MTTYISILRGINVGGHKMIKMDTLKKAILATLDLQTYKPTFKVAILFISTKRQTPKK